MEAEARDQRGEDHGREVAEPVAGGNHAHGPPALAHKPSHDGQAEGVGSAYALPQGHDHARGIINGQGLRLRKEQQGDGDDRHPCDRHLPWPNTVQDVARDRGEESLLQHLDRIAQGDGCDAPAGGQPELLQEDAEPEEGDA